MITTTGFKSVASHSDSNDLYLFRWMADQGLSVRKLDGMWPTGKSWVVMDSEYNDICTGPTAIAALQAAHDRLDNPSDEEATRDSRQRITERDIDRADHARDEAKDNRR